MEHGSLPRAMCSGAFLKLVTPLLSAKIVAWQRSGAGKRLAVLEPETLVRFYRQHFPHRAGEVLLASARVAGVAQFRDSKSLGSTDAEIVVLRAWRNGGLTHGGMAVNIVVPTIDHGAFCFVLRPKGSFAITGKVALVENPAVFLEFESLGADLPMVIFGHGRISDRLLDWLASQEGEGFGLVHFGDYDPVGLDEFGRISAKCGERARLHIPPNLPDLFQKYSNPKLLTGATSQRLLAGVRESTNPDVRRVVELIDCHNGGLEQEALLIGPEA